jgi:hypothetical protein
MTSTNLYQHFHHIDQNLPALPPAVEWLLPFQEYPEAEPIFQTFLERFYADTTPRTLVLGINPGRFGGGITNVAFTDPQRLEEELGIANPFPKKPELSAQFVYAVIRAYGGPEVFYQRFFLNSVCPLGFVKHGKNYNYYDEKPLQNAVLQLIKTHLEGLIYNCGMRRDRCICLGEGKNADFFQALNAQEGYFEKIIPLPHPRFVMQYKRKRMEEYVERYLEALGTGE